MATTHDQENIILSGLDENVDDTPLSDGLPSSPLARPQPTRSAKPKRPPTITPRKFERFFRVRSQKQRHRSPASGQAARQLQELNRNALNRRSICRAHDSDVSPIGDDTTGFGGFGDDLSSSQAFKRRKRKGAFSPDSSPLRYSPADTPSKKRQTWHPSSSPIKIFVDYDSDYVPPYSPKHLNCRAPPAPIRRLKSSGLNAGSLLRSFGGRETRDTVRVLCPTFRSIVADFYTQPEYSHTYPQKNIPFSAATCRTNSLIAIGDVGGGVRILETDLHKTPSFDQAYISFRPHDNSIMDMAFSSDDRLLATASGDQTTHIIEMSTQQTKCVFRGHTTSVKQVRFQPTNDNIVATSSRDGSVRIWDMRCSGRTNAVHEMVPCTSFDPSLPVESRYSPSGEIVERSVKFATSYNDFIKAHADDKCHLSNVTCDRDRTPNTPSTRRTKVSVTCLAFLNAAGRDHLLLTASEAATSVKLWDIRSRQGARHRGIHSTPSSTSGVSAVPLSTSRQPASHLKHRAYGTSSLTLSGDGARLYALSRDCTVYAYSTNHLLLGQAPEFDCLSPNATTQQKPRSATNQDGPGPLYGLRHPALKCSTFFVKAALRPARDGQPELLATGGSDGSAVLFPTDERSFGPPTTEADNYLPHQQGKAVHTSSCNEDAEPNTVRMSRPSLRRGPSTPSLLLRPHDDIPVYTPGTPLVNGHEKEVTVPIWAQGGELVTLSDDFRVRRWREDREKAREVRRDVRGGGRAFGWGWADTSPEWDDEDE